MHGLLIALNYSLPEEQPLGGDIGGLDSQFTHDPVHAVVGLQSGHILGKEVVNLSLELGEASELLVQFGVPACESASTGGHIDAEETEEGDGQKQEHEGNQEEEQGREVRLFASGGGNHCLPLGGVSDGVGGYGVVVIVEVALGHGSGGHGLSGGGSSCVVADSRGSSSCRIAG